MIVTEKEINIFWNAINCDGRTYPEAMQLLVNRAIEQMRVYVLIEIEDPIYQTSNVCGVLALEESATTWVNADISKRTYEVHILDRILS
jgi:hypothetical protein